MYLGIGVGVAVGSFIVFVLIAVFVWLRCKGYRLTNQKVNKSDHKQFLSKVLYIAMSQ